MSDPYCLIGESPTNALLEDASGKLYVAPPGQLSAQSINRTGSTSLTHTHAIETTDDASEVLYANSILKATDGGLKLNRVELVESVIYDGTPMIEFDVDAINNKNRTKIKGQLRIEAGFNLQINDQIESPPVYYDVWLENNYWYRRRLQ